MTTPSIDWSHVPAFPGWPEATKGLLLETARALNLSGARYVIVGGWVPVIFGGRPDLKHFGTRDVDVLFDGEFSDMNKAAKQLLKAGFLPSAKHDFQLLMPIRVQSQPFVFNVDFMHPAEAQTKPGLMTEVLDLGVDDRFDPSGTGKRWVRSVIFKSAPLVFSDRLFRPATVSGKVLDGTEVTTAITLLTESAFILSKAESVREAKRPRDAFDIYYVVAGPRHDEIRTELTELAVRHQSVVERLTQLADWIEEHAASFTDRVELYAQTKVPDAVSLVVSTLRYAATPGAATAGAS